mmetsp:Transcript_22226/g.21459  ORF Transcript_22226/g.21459 Transcript_22226/m.21459 type:complete len:103 (-) Transcript_22226:25-333(-)
MTNKKYGMGLCAIVVVAIICTISNTTPSNMAASPVSMNKIYELFVPDGTLNTTNNTTLITTNNATLKTPNNATLNTTNNATVKTTNDATIKTTNNATLKTTI